MVVVEDSAPFKGTAQQIIEKESPISSIPQKLYHYTSSDGLKGMVEWNRIRMGDTAFLNDGSELTYGLEIFNHCVADFSKRRSVYDKDILQQVVDQVHRDYSGHRGIVFCLSEENNLLNQWRDYGKDVTSYSLEFDTAGLTDNNWNFIGTLVRMIYSQKKQIRMMKTLISRMHREFVSLKKMPGYIDKHADELKMRASAELSWLLYRFKNPAFEAEREWRVLALIPFVLGKANLKFRTSSLGVIPYFEWERAKELKLPISLITVGPSPYGNISNQALNIFLEAKGYQVDTRFSLIPIRV
jgi:hypothetical protein